MLKVNDRVQIHGRNSMTEFNGSTGKILSIDPKAFDEGAEHHGYIHVELDNKVRLSPTPFGTAEFKSVWVGVGHLRKIVP